MNSLTNLHLPLKGGLKEPNGITAGDRPDNQWLQYNSSNLPRTQQDWDSCTFVEKTHWGYYCWPRFSVNNICFFSICPVLCDFLSFTSLICIHHPLISFSRKLMMYAPLEEQPKHNLIREEMTEVCQHVHICTKCAVKN